VCILIFHTARIEYRQLLDLDLIHVKAAVLVATGKIKPQKKGSAMSLERTVTVATPSRGAGGSSTVALEDEDEDETSLLDVRLTDQERLDIEARLQKVDEALAERYQAALAEVASEKHRGGRDRAASKAELARQNSSTLGFLGRLSAVGPFSLAWVDLPSVGFAKEPGTPQYSLALELPALAGLRAYPFLGTMSALTPWAPLSTDEAERAAADIPERALYAAWAYPLPGVEEVDSPGAMLESAASLAERASLGLAINGGFVFANSGFKPVAVRAVVGKLDAAGDAPPLHLEGPHPLSAECRGRLEQGGRLLPPTDLKHIKDGVTGYAWVEGSEGGLALEDGSECRAGAFVFVYDDARHDRFFCAARPAEPLAYSAAI